MQYSLGPLLGRRGPDAASAHCVGVGGGMTMCLEGAVLHMRDLLTPQPLVGSGGDALLWNGEVFAGLKVWVTCKCIHTNIEVVCASDLLCPTSQSGTSGPAEACVVRKITYIYPLTLAKDHGDLHRRFNSFLLPSPLATSPQLTSLCIHTMQAANGIVPVLTLLTLSSDGSR